MTEMNKQQETDLSCDNWNGYQKAYTPKLTKNQIMLLILQALQKDYFVEGFTCTWFL